MEEKPSIKFEPGETVEEVLRRLCLLEEIVKQHQTTLEKQIDINKCIAEKLGEQI